jgi:hypothetical protein
MTMPAAYLGSAAVAVATVLSVSAAFFGSAISFSFDFRMAPASVLLAGAAVVPDDGMAEGADDAAGGVPDCCTDGPGSEPEVWIFGRFTFGTVWEVAEYALYRGDVSNPCAGAAPAMRTVAMRAAAAAALRGAFISVVLLTVRGMPR